MTKILAIDDQRNNLIAIKAAIRTYLPDCTVLTERSGEGGLLAAKTERPDTILLDVVMPQMDGFEVCKRLKADKSTRHIPVMLITAYKTDIESCVKGLNIGADAFISKPIDTSELLARLNSLLRIKETEDELRKDKEHLLKSVEENSKKIIFQTTVLKNISDPVISFDLENHITSWNKAAEKLYGWREDEVIGKSYNEVLMPEFSEERILIDKNPINIRGTCHGEVIHRSKKGGQHKIQYTISSIIDDGGFYIGMVSINRDITEQEKIKEALFESEEKFKAIFENNASAIAIVEPDTTISMVNDAYCELTGYTRAETIGMSWTKLIPQDDLPRMKEFNRKRLIDPKSVPSKYEFTYFNKKEEVRNVLLSISFNEKNKKMIVSFFDITERKHAEMALLKFRTISDQANYGSAISNMDGKFDYVNETFARMHGWEIKDLLGHHFSVVLSNEQKPSLGVFANQLIEEGSFGARGIWHKRKDGSVFPALVNVTLIKDDQGNSQFLAVTVIDITKLKKVENDFRESEERYKTIFNTVTDVILLTKLDGTIIDVNLGFIEQSGYNREESIGFTLFDLNIYASPEERNKLLYLLESQVRVHNFEALLRHRDGSLKAALISASIIYINNEKHILSVTRDISERKKNEQDLIKSKEKAEVASRLKTSLLLNMSHELRTPLNGILGFAGLLGDELDDPQQRKMAAIIDLSGRRLMATLNSILDLSQVESDRTLMEIEVCDIGETVSEVLTKHQSLFKKNKIQLDQLIEQEVYSNLDKNLLSNIIFHLMENAIKYSEEGSVSIIVTKEINNDKGYAVLKVKDTGIGIPEEQFEYIFDAFRQGSEGYGRSHEGAGLGLTLCQKFVKLMGGDIDVKSEVGIGSTFTVTFPLSEKPSEKKEIKTREENLWKESLTGDKPRILIVEDNEVNSELIALYLKGKFITEQVYSGSLAINMTNLNNYDVILMDINLGHGLNGIDTAKEIRKIDRYLLTPIIAVTGYSTEGEKREILGKGFDYFISKPFNREDLISIIWRAIKNIK